MKKGLAALLAVVVVAAAGFFWWVNSPAHAVLCASDALKHHDVTEFHHWVDVHTVAEGAVEDLLAEPVRHAGAGLLERVVGITIVSVLRGGVVEALAGQIDSWVAHGAKPKSQASLDVVPPALAQTGDDDNEDEAPPKSLMGAIVQLIKPPSLKQLFKEYGLTRKNFRGLGSMDQSDHSAHVGLKFYSPKLEHEYEIKLELVSGAGNWQITRIANLQEVVGELTGG